MQWAKVADKNLPYARSGESGIREDYTTMKVYTILDGFGEIRVYGSTSKVYNHVTFFCGGILRRNEVKFIRLTPTNLRSGLKAQGELKLYENIDATDWCFKIKMHEVM